MLIHRSKARSAPAGTGDVARVGARGGAQGATGVDARRRTALTDLLGLGGLGGLLGLGGASMLALVGCSPAYDWREAGAARGYVALFPARPATEVRQLTVLGQTIALALTSAEAQGNVFALADARLPAALIATPDMRERLAQEFEAARLRSLQGRVTRRAVPALAGQTVQLAREFEAIGPTAAGERKLVVRQYLLGDRWFELLVMGDGATLPPDAVETFMRGFRPL